MLTENAKKDSRTRMKIQFEFDWITQNEQIFHRACRCQKSLATVLFSPELENLKAEH